MCSSALTSGLPSARAITRTSSKLGLIRHMCAGAVSTLRLQTFPTSMSTAALLSVHTQVMVPKLSSRARIVSMRVDLPVPGGPRTRVSLYVK